MESNRNVKVVYEDNGISKVIKGKIILQDEFTITILPVFSQNEIIVGRRAIVKIEVSE